MLQLRKQSHLIEYSVNCSLIEDFGFAHNLDCKRESAWSFLSLPHKTKAALAYHAFENEVRLIDIPLHEIMLRVP